MKIRAWHTAMVAAAVLFTFTLLGGPSPAAQPYDAPRPAADAATAGRSAWYTSWAQSQQGLAEEPLRNQTVRTIARLSQGGSAVRIRVQNQFGQERLDIAHASVAVSRDGGPAVRTGTTRELTFSGSEQVGVPVGGEVWSDPVRLPTEAQTDLAVSLHVPGTIRPGVHGAAWRDNYLTSADSGDHTTDADGSAFTVTTPSTYLVSAVDVRSPRIRGTIVAYGSSVVDGAGSTDCGPGCTPHGTDQRWTDVLARRVVRELPADRQLAIANAGINGTPSAPDCPGTSDVYDGLDASARLDRDVLALHGVTGVIFFYGTNDLQNRCTSEQILDSYRKVFSRLRAAGVKVYVIPSTPRPGYTDQMNRYRWDIGTWAGHQGDCGGACDGVIDFDQVIKDPVAPNSISAKYDVGDGVHVNIAGHRAEAETISLRMLLSSGY
ncbi:GDSL-type esterase/lipase family protein [Streptomyces sp. NPDC050211]|uniref:GDSL-type esterase/lipase family protein n=1 Tax=Streptomyces sp. NPDC050211 TaxID=3154932 RepID=UPI00343AA0D8